MNGADDRRTIDALAGLLVAVERVPKRHRPALTAAACELIRLHGIVCHLEGRDLAR